MLVVLLIIVDVKRLIIWVEGLALWLSRHTLLHRIVRRKRSLWIGLERSGMLILLLLLADVETPRLSVLFLLPQEVSFFNLLLQLDLILSLLLLFFLSLILRVVLLRCQRGAAYDRMLMLVAILTILVDGLPRVHH